MFRNVTMLFLAVAVLFGSVHVTPWSHELAGTHGHSHELTHDDHETANAEDSLADVQPLKNADVPGDVGHQHSMPTGIESSNSDFDARDIKRQSVSLVAQTTIPPSHSRAPPTQPPSA